MILIKEAMKKGYVEIHMGECFDAENPNSETRRGRKMETKSNCLMSKDTDFMRYEGPRIITLNGRKVRVIGMQAHAHRVREVADNPDLVQVGVQRLAGIPDAGKRLDGRGHQAHLLFPAGGVESMNDKLTAAWAYVVAALIYICQLPMGGLYERI